MTTGSGAFLWPSSVVGFDVGDGCGERAAVLVNDADEAAAGRVVGEGERDGAEVAAVEGVS
jgi:hypothetical protein